MRLCVNFNFEIYKKRYGILKDGFYIGIQNTVNTVWILMLIAFIGISNPIREDLLIEIKR